MTPAPTTAPAPLLVDAAGVAGLLNISRTSVFGLLAAGRLPPPCLRSGRIVRWSGGEIQAWIAAGCPPADRWQIMKGSS
jgi:predicted DNA-binding transcriptional regulator AlpA